MVEYEYSALLDVLPFLKNTDYDTINWKFEIMRER